MRSILSSVNTGRLPGCYIAGLILFFCVTVHAETRLPVIDMHVHAFIADWTTGNAPINPATKQPSTAATGGDLLAETLDIMKRYNVVKGIVSGSLTALEEWVEADPERFIGSPIFPVGFDVISVEEWPDVGLLEEELRQGRIGALGEITTQYGGMPPNTPALDPYYEFAVKHDIPFAIHIAGSGAPGFPKLRLALGKPLYLEEVLPRYPDLRIYVMHAGFPFLDEMIALMIHFPDLYVDLGWISWATPEATYYDYLKGLMDAELGKRIMFGSDQAWWPEAIGLAIDRIEQAGFLTESQKRDILYNNAARFLAIE